MERVLQKGPLSLAGCELTISQFVEETMVKISGIIQNISEETLELYFENTKRSGGGEIKHIDMLPSMQAAIITFEDAAGTNVTFSSIYFLFIFNNDLTLIQVGRA